MIKFQEAYETVIKSAILLKTEKISLNNALGRILAEDVFSDINMPPFDKAAMDGFACKGEDIYKELEVIEVIPAGKMPEKEVKSGQCSKIMTGAPMPKGANAIIIVEDIEELPNGKVKYTEAAPELSVCSAEEGMVGKPNVCFIGEDMNEGGKVLSKGVVLKAQHIAVLASVGCTEPEVSVRPKVGVIATGSELVEPHIKPGLSQIRNSNGTQMLAQLTAMSVIANYYGIAEDDEQITLDIVKKATEENDMIMLSGGVSMGDFDFVPLILKKVGFEIKFDRVAIQPGKPTTFATGNGKFCFGMPGNPVSSFVQFELLAKPFLYKMMGTDFKPFSLKLPLGKAYSRKRAGRLSWIPINITDEGEVLLVEYNGSAHVNGLIPADGLMSVPIGIFTINKGEKVNVRQI